MEQMLQEQILQVKEDSQQKVSASVLNLLQHCEKFDFFQTASKAKRLSTHYSSLLAEREAHIEKLEEKETSLQQTLSTKVTSESNLKRERNLLLSVSKNESFISVLFTLAH